MGKRGPKPTPSAIIELTGNPGKRRRNHAEPVSQLPAVKPSVVAMDPLASGEWDRVIHAMPPEIYTALDVAVLAQYSLAWSMLVKAQKEIDENGITVTLFEKDQSGELCPVKLGTNPAVKVWRTAIDTLMKTTDRLGLSPGVRSRLEIPGLSRKKDEKPKSGFAGLLGRTP